MLRQAMKKKLPGAVLKRYDKMGFPTPQVEWMEEYPEFFLERLKDITQHSGIFTDDLLAMAGAALEKKERSFYPVIWRVVGFGAWAGRFLEMIFSGARS